MKVLAYTFYKEHCDLYTEIHGLIAVNSCQIGLAQKDIILLSSISVRFCKAGARTTVENLASQRALIQLIILTQKSRSQSYNKDKTGYHLKLMT